MRICIEKSTGRLIELQSDATQGTLIKNAINAGFDPLNIEEKEVTLQEYEIAKQSLISKKVTPLKVDYATLLTDTQRINFIAKILGLT